MTRFLLSIAILLFAALTAAAQPVPSIVATATERCDGDGVLIAAGDSADRFYVVTVCDGALRIGVYDSSLVAKGITSYGERSAIAVLSAAVDSRGDLYVCFAFAGDSAAILKATRDGALDWARTFDIRSKEWVTAPGFLIVRDTLIVAHARDSANGALIDVRALNGGGAAIWRRVHFVAGGTFSSIAPLVTTDGRIHVVAGHTSTQDLGPTELYDAVYGFDGTEHRVGKTSIASVATTLRNVEPLPGGGFATLWRDGTGEQQVRLVTFDSSARERWRDARISLNGSAEEIHADAEGNIYQSFSRIVDGRTSVRCALQKIGFSGEENWLREVFPGFETPDSLATRSGISAVALDRRGRMHIGGLSGGNLVVGRIESVDGSPAWTYYRPYTYAPQLGYPYVAAIEPGATGAIWAAVTEKESESAPFTFTILKIRESGSAGVPDDDDSRANHRTNLFAAEPRIAPNPVGDAARLRFATNREVFLTIELFDAAGARRATLASRSYEPGDHEIAVSPETYDLPPGAYFVRVAAAGAARTLPFTVMK